MEVRKLISLRATVVISFFLQQCISEVIICSNTNSRCLLQAPINPIGTGSYLPPRVINFFYKDTEEMSAFSWKMDPTTNTNLLQGFQMIVIGTSDATSGIYYVISFKVQNANVSDSFRFDQGFQFPGNYRIQLYPIPSDNNLSNKMEKDITFIGTADITNINLLNAAEMRVDGRPASELTIDGTSVNSLTFNPFTATLTYPEVAFSIRSRLKGYHTLVTSIIGGHNRRYYDIFRTDIDANTNDDVIMRVTTSITGIIPGYYEFRVTPYMDTLYRQCRQPGIYYPERPCKSIFRTFPIGHFVCIQNGNFSMKCHELAMDTVGGHTSFVWAMEEDIASGSYHFTTELSSKEPLPTTRQVFSCLRRNSIVEQCVDLQNTLELCSTTPTKCKISPALVPSLSSSSVTSNSSSTSITPTITPSTLPSTTCARSNTPSTTPSVPSVIFLVLSVIFFQ